MRVAAQAPQRANPQLAEFLAAVAAYPDGADAMTGAVEWSAEAFDAEVAAIVRDRSVVTSVGFPRSSVPEEHLVAAAAGLVDQIEVPGVGACGVVSVELNRTALTQLVLARRIDDPFTREEVNLLRSVVRILDLTLGMFSNLDEARSQARRNESLVGSLSERQALLERLSRIQRSISHRAVLREVLDSIVLGARELVGDETAGLCLFDSDNPRWLVMASWSGPDPESLGISRRARIEEGIRGRAVSMRELVVAVRGPEGGEVADLDPGLSAAMAAPVHEKGRIVGCLAVGSLRPGRQYSATEQEMLLAFAEHASLALTDSQTVEAMHEALHDPLTGLANRVLFLDRLDHALLRAGGSGSGVAVLFIDLDRFKIVNDSLGHAAGDQLLVATARRLQASLRSVDTAARLGGDEFVVLIEAPGGHEAVAAVASAIQDSLRPPFLIAGREVFMSAGVGIAHATPLTRDGEEMLLQADLAMNRAKAQEPLRVAVFEQEMHVALTERMELEGYLQRALERGELAALFQPVVDLNSRRIAGVEALLRWDHPRRGVLEPAAFLHLAEETGLIVPMGWWILAESLRRAAAWPPGPAGPAPFVSVNLGAVQLAQADVVERIRDGLVGSGVDPSRLVIEITETVLMRDTEKMADRLWRLRELGPRVAIDDFGIGYSSLAYLSGFPIDILKIPKTFVDRVGRGQEESTITRAIVSLSQTLRLEAIAEGIEERVQLEVLHGLGCRYGQGHLFGPPMAADSLDGLLASSAPLGPSASPGRRTGRSSYR